MVKRTLNENVQFRLHPALQKKKVSFGKHVGCDAMNHYFFTGKRRRLCAGAVIYPNKMYPLSLYDISGTIYIYIYISLPFAPFYVYGGIVNIRILRTRQSRPPKKFFKIEICNVVHPKN